MKFAQEDPAIVRWGLIGLTYLVVGVLIILPLVNIFVVAFSDGLAGYWNHLFGDPDTRHSMLMTLIVAPCAVVLNVIFGIAAAWLITRFQFPGRTFLTAMLDLPFAISPVVAGLMYMLLFGMQGFFGPWLADLDLPFLGIHGIKLVYNWTGLVLITTFVTMPFVARELIPIMEAIGPDEEIAAVSLGANGWQIFWRITVPNMKWGLLFGIILCNARAMGEYGAARVVSGGIAGQTDTMPIHIEKLYTDKPLPASYAVASVLTLLSVVTLLLRVWLEHKTQAQIEQAKAEHAVSH